MQTLIAVLLPLISALVLVRWQTPQTKAWVTFAAISASLGEAVLLERYQRRYQTNGVNEQEVFDCAVLRLDWPRGLAGSKPSPESTQEVVRGISTKDPDLNQYKNWYPQRVQVLPLHLAQLLCQRCNAWWDSRLRRVYAGALQGVSVAVVVVVLAVGLSQSRKLDDLILTVYAPLSPLLIWGIKAKRRHSDYADFSEMLQALAEDLWRKAIEGSLPDVEIFKQTRALQDAVYYRRRTAPFIPDWIQNRQQRRYSELITASVEEMLREAAQAHLI